MLDYAAVYLQHIIISDFHKHLYTIFVYCISFIMCVHDLKLSSDNKPLFHLLSACEYMLEVT